MRRIKLGKFDAVITIFNAIGHLTKPDFEITLQNIYTNLKDNGLYVFDILNLEALTDNVVSDFFMHSESIIKGTKVCNIQRSEINRDSGLLHSYDQYTIYEKENDPKIYSNNFSLQIYTSLELQKLLTKNGFEVIGQYDMNGNNFEPEKSINILTVARKINGLPFSIDRSLGSSN